MQITESNRAHVYRALSTSSIRRAQSPGYLYSLQQKASGEGGGAMLDEEDEYYDTEVDVRRQGKKREDATQTEEGAGRTGTWR